MSEIITFLRFLLNALYKLLGRRNVPAMLLASPTVVANLLHLMRRQTECLQGFCQECLPEVLQCYAKY